MARAPGSPGSSPDFRARPCAITSPSMRCFPVPLTPTACAPTLSSTPKNSARRRPNWRRRGRRPIPPAASARSRSSATRAPICAARRRASSPDRTSSWTVVPTPARSRIAEVLGGGSMKALFAVVSFFLTAAAVAQPYPSHAVKVIVPWPPGQATDIAARMVAQKLQEQTGQPFVIDNRPGAGGSLGTAVAATSPADGYTLLAASSGPISIMPSLQKLTYEPQKDFVLISLITRNPYALVVNPSFPANNAKEFVALLKANPDKYTFASSGTGATSHLLTELFNSMAQVKARHIPYKGSAPAITDVLNGQVDYMVETVASMAGHIRAGRLKALGVSTAKRPAALPDVPTLAEAAGLPDYDAAAWIGYAAPAGIPREALARLSAEIQKGLQTADMQEKLLNAGLDPVASTPEELPAFMRREQERYATVIKNANIKIEP